MGFASQKDRYAAWGLLAIPVFIVVSFVYLAVHLLVFIACLVAIDAALSWVFSSTSAIPWGWWTLAEIALAIATTIGLARCYDRAVLSLRRRRGAPTDGENATTLRKDMGKLFFGGVDWVGLFLNLIVLVPAIVAAVYIVKSTVVRWMDPSPFVAKVIVVLVALVIAYPLLRLEDRVRASAKKRRPRNRNE
ncbi:MULTISPECIES: hypothetical protein [Tsukamurella]|uniref:Uncharacterized protein n=2 Tax=Tsukamurella TaxID=2060 RepID=A0A5C5RVN5_9ACTN|nr:MULTISPECIES: hypothetical protein [Tsukamurella]NMD57976.1 hypothetical protein [Tsukamurella columbiensis]TWS26834.1 hypothetical protein FK530_21395 [Tsukamurella conjunctivitidis]